MSRTPTLNMQQRRAAQELYSLGGWSQEILGKDVFGVSRSAVQRVVAAGEVTGPQKGSRHGTSSYAHGRCACAACLAAWRDYQRDYRKRAVSEGETL